jgi:hypothetical protein
MSKTRATLQLAFALMVSCLLLLDRLRAEQIPVRHKEGVSLGFLVLRNPAGEAIAYGNLQQVVAEEGYVMDDLKFKFKDGSFYQEIAKFTQNTKFRLLSDQVVQRGPSFKQPIESWIDATTGKITVRAVDGGKAKVITKQMNLPPDLANGLLMILAKNIDPGAARTSVSMLNVSTNPTLVRVNFSPQPEATFHVGATPYKAQQYLLKIEVAGIKGKIAPLIGKHFPEMRLWLIKSEAPTFVKFQGPLYEGGPVWSMELADPRDGSPQAKNK